jgi:flagellar FliJ protein
VARFRFKFQKVLDARNAVEKDKRKDLMIARNQLTELEKEYQRIGGEIISQRELFSKQRDHEENANNWALRQSYLDMLNSLQGAVAKRIDRQKDIIEEKRIKLMEASRDRKTMEILCTKHYDDFVSTENRQEQVFLNEIGQFQTIKKSQDNG